MQINNEILENVVFVGVENKGAFMPLGTGVLGFALIGDTSFLYLVTANHVVNSISGDEISIRVNRKSGGCETVKISKQFRLMHSDESNDVAAFCITLDPSIYEFRVVRFDRANMEQGRKEFWNPSLGDEVVTIGLYTSHYGLTKNIPVVRVGHIAALPGEPVRTEFGYVSAYLIETKSIAGLSGSPVYLSVPQIRVHEGRIQTQPSKAHPILGILVGYHVVESKEDQISVPQFQQHGGAKSASAERGVDERNTGFAVVIPIERILDILESPEVVEGMKQSIELNRNSGYRVASAPVSVSEKIAVSTAPAADNPSHKEDFTSLLSAAATANKPAF